MQIDLENIEYKPLNEREIEVSLKRLVRFKYPPDKKNRVFKQILTSHTINPKISTKVFNSMKKAQIDELVSFIWNNSIEESNKFNLWQDDVRCFNSKRMLEDILGVSLSSKFDKKIMNKILDDNGYKISKNAQGYDDIYQEIQSQYSLNISEKTKLPNINKVVLVEGATEEILLPKFAKAMGVDFEKEGILIIAAGGKNQVAKAYLEHKYTMNLPIVILLDADAQEQADDIEKVIRDKDKIHLIAKGEFEDILGLKLILKALNKEFKNTAKVVTADLKMDLPMTATLYELYKIKGFGDFKKVEFAKVIAENIDSDNDVSSELRVLINSFF